MYIFSLLLFLLCFVYSYYYEQALKGDLFLNCTLKDRVKLSTFGKGTRKVTFQINEYPEMEFNISGVNYSDFLNLTQGSYLELLVNKGEFDSKSVSHLFYISNGGRIFLDNGELSNANKSNVLIGVIFGVLLLIYQIYLFYYKDRDSMKYSPPSSLSSIKKNKF
ncbi:hypothetical protein [Polluticaenibacter yanchengensis]|uniref:DUF3592 domain-containing protein n=1 Tax=Polluticaenibacter yanchengensis TaxID=3014562 RepID=A0ABT4UNB2_9BACT|nr:hypothetical protein [Chitinophagaceae bacterium LY-5]